MYRILFTVWGLFISSLLCQNLTAQISDSVKPQPKPLVSVLIPLYLDSAYSDSKYRYGSNVPPYLLNGIEFYNGVKLASEELQAEGLHVRIVVTDTKGTKFNADQWKKSIEGQAAIVICSPQSAMELKTIADKLRPAGIPLLSMLPNDAGINGYPNFMIINPTLQTHCTQLYKMLQRYHSIDNLLMLTPRGAAETRLKGYLNAAAKNSPSVPLKWRESALADSFSSDDIMPLLDSMQNNILVVPTLQTHIAQKLIKMLAGIKDTYRCTVVGMPTWETIALAKPELKGVDVYYGTPFLTTSGNADLYEAFAKKFKNMTNALPGDMASRGYEITLRYVRLLVAYGPDFMKHINDAQFKIFNDFYFEPVGIEIINQKDYLENERIYFIKKTDGQIRSIITP
jgi:hypothetical protein